MFSHRNIWYAVWNVQHRVFFISSWHIGDSEHGFIPKLWPALVDRAKFWRRVLDDKTIHKLPSPFNNKADELAVLYRGLSINILILNICSYYCFQIYLKMQDNTEQTDYAEHFPTISEVHQQRFFIAPYDQIRFKIPRTVRKLNFLATQSTTVTAVDSILLFSLWLISSLKLRRIKPKLLSDNA